MKALPPGFRVLVNYHFYNVSWYGPVAYEPGLYHISKFRDRL